MPVIWGYVGAFGVTDPAVMLSPNDAIWALTGQVSAAKIARVPIARDSMSIPFHGLRNGLGSRFDRRRRFCRSREFAFIVRQHEGRELEPRRQKIDQHVELIFR